MRKLNRKSVKRPTSLSRSTPNPAVIREKTEATTYYGTRVPWTGTDKAFTFNAYKAPDVKAALYKLTGGKCAYCESKIYGSGAREVEHYRPKGGIQGVVHPGYWWLAHSWFNLLPTCRDCNKSLKQHIVTATMTITQVEELLSKGAMHLYGKGTQFDIQGPRAVGTRCVLENEDPLLIDPCRRDPTNELSWDFSTELPLIEAKLGAHGPSPYGSYTIKTCALNRAGLVLDRIAVMEMLRNLRIRIVDRMTAWDGSQNQLDEILRDVSALGLYAQPNQPFAGMAAAYLKDFEEELDRWRVARGLPPF